MKPLRTPRVKEVEEVITVDYDSFGLSHLHYVIPKPHNVRELTVPRQDDRELKLELFLPCPEKKSMAKTKTMVLFPGCTVQGYEMSNIAERFAKQGFVVWVVDFSVGEVESHSFCHYTISQLIKDVKDVIDFVYAHPYTDKKNIFMAGHSFGAFSSLLYLARHDEKRIKAAIGICPVVDVVEVGINHIQQIVHKAPRWERVLRVWVWKARRILRNIAFFAWKACGKFEFIVKNGKKVFLSREFLYDIIKHNNKEKVMRELSKIRVPCLLLHGEDDPWVKLENVKEIYETICSSAKHLLIMKDVGHLPLDRLGAEQIITKALPWLESVGGGILQEIPQLFSIS